MASPALDCAFCDTPMRVVSSKGTARPFFHCPRCGFETSGAIPYVRGAIRMADEVTDRRTSQDHKVVLPSQSRNSYYRKATELTFFSGTLDQERPKEYVRNL